MKKMPGLMSAKEMNDWQAEDDLRTLMQAEQIEKDPKRMKAARALAKKRLAELAAITQEKE